MNGEFNASYYFIHIINHKLCIHPIYTTYIECWFGVESYYVKDKHINTYTHTQSTHSYSFSLVELFIAF